jgi:phosphoribosylamine--glycine ligase
MGAYRDSRILTDEQTGEIVRTVIEPAIGQMAAEGRPFTGFLYAGLMMTPAGPRVLEFNARLGDPETQPLMHGMTSDLARLLLSAARADLAGAAPLAWSEGSSVCVVLAASGYPGKVRTGDSIHGIEAAEAQGAVVFQAGIRTGGKGLETAGGRVLGVTASGPDLRTAIHDAYSAARQIRFDGMHFRSDIGAKGLRRY